MTAVLQEAQVVPVASAAVLPRVNLLPPEIGERLQLRRVQSALGLGVLAALGATALLYLGATSSVAQAQESLGAASAQHTRLVQSTHDFQDVTAVYTRTAAAEAMLVDAMSEEVRYSRFLDAFSTTLPDRVWVTDLTFTQTPPATTGTDGSATPIGTVTITGTAYAHDDVAVWLETLADLEGFDAPYLQSSTERLLGGRTVVDFTTSVQLTSEALSGRFVRTGG